MKPRADITAVIVAAVLIAGLIIALIAVIQERDYLRFAYGRYLIDNGKNYSRYLQGRDAGKYDAIAADFCIPAEVLWAVATHENIAEGQTFGVKRIPKWIADRYRPELWQAAAAANIVREEMRDFIFNNGCSKDGQPQLRGKNEKPKTVRREFFVYLGQRYCGWDANWGESVNKIYEQQLKKSKEENRK